jgi:DNA primase
LQRRLWITSGGVLRTQGEVFRVRIDPGVIRDVLARTDLAALIGSYVSLSKRGNDLVGLCPFHSEKTPSFHVHPDRGFFKCFGCGLGGDAIRFLSQIENVPFPEAVRTLAKRAGIAVEEETPAAARARSEKELIYRANEFAADYFHRMLVRDPAGEPARRYCTSRGLSRETILAFKLGFAPDRWDGLVAELEREGIDLGIAAKAGLVKPGQHGYYDFYRRRLMVPTLSTTGEVIAFGGRALGDEEPKYLNTTTTPVYTKGKYLFALNVARRAAAAEGSFIVGEGYLDCIALHQAGFHNAVASLGTAFTAEQAGEIKKYSPNVFLCFDGDAAGQSATLKSIDTLIAAGCSARVVRLPPGEDPDSFVRSHGADGFRDLLAQAVPWIEFKLDREIETVRAGFRGAAEIAREAETLVRRLPREEWDRWRVYVAGRLGLSVDDLRRSRFLLETKSVPGVRAAHLTRRASVAAGTTGRVPSFEQHVMEIILLEPQLARAYVEKIPPQSFSDETYRRIYERIAERAADLGEPSDLTALFADDEQAINILADLGGLELDADDRRVHLERIVAKLEADRARARYEELNKLQDEKFAAGEPIPTALRDEFRALVSKLKG